MVNGNGMNDAVRDLQTLFSVGATGALSDGELLDRFVARREEAIFEAITHRHGPMVWGVCRRVLRDHHDAEDAFQATFLVLARKASSVMPREKLGNWLYGVAYQTAMKARAMRAKRRVRESQVSDMPEPMAVPHDLRDALAESLDRELCRLPEKYRIPIVLCDLEGMTHNEAASQLGWPIGTVSGRLSRARSMLAKRLARRGISLSVGSLAVLLAKDASSASVPTQLIGSTAQAASLFAAGRAVTAGVVSAEVVTLMEGVLKTMLLSKIKIVMVALMMVAVVGGGGGMFRVQFNAAKADQPKATKGDQPDKILEKLQGVWSGVVAEVGGKRTTPSEDIPEPKAQILIKGDRFTLRGPMYGTVIGFGEPVDTKFTFTADTGESNVPKALELTVLPAPDDSSPTIYQGIYWLNGDELIICLATPNKRRPAKFRTVEKTTQMLLKLKRDRTTEWKELPERVLQPQSTEGR